MANPDKPISTSRKVWNAIKNTPFPLTSIQNNTTQRDVHYRKQEAEKMRQRDIAQEPERQRQAEVRQANIPPGGIDYKSYVPASLQPDPRAAGLFLRELTQAIENGQTGVAGVYSETEALIQTLRQLGYSFDYEATNNGLRLVNVRKQEAQPEQGPQPWQRAEYQNPLTTAVIRQELQQLIGQIKDAGLPIDTNTDEGLDQVAEVIAGRRARFLISTGIAPDQALAQAWKEIDSA